MLTPELAGSEEGYLIFLINGKEYGINVNMLSLIINPLENYSIGKSFYIRNDSIKINNEEISFFDFYGFYNVNPPPQSKDTRIIIAVVDNIKTAFYVEEVIGYISLSPQNIFHSDNSSNPKELFIKWQIKYGPRDILFPDFGKIFNCIL